MNSSNQLLPLCCDLDGTFIKSDILWELVLLEIKARPYMIFILPWLAVFSSKLKFKELLAERNDLNVKTIPIDESVHFFLKEEWARGRRVYLVTASLQKYADLFVNEYRIFNGGFGSLDFNLKGPKKAEFLNERFGSRGYGYVGDSLADFAVWNSARDKYFVVHGMLKKLFFLPKVKFDRVIERKSNGPLKNLIKATRITQWVKNFLIFVPLVTAHRELVPGEWSKLVIAFLLFSLTASSIYIVNDLLDLESDRLHKNKKKRPLASGNMSIQEGILLFSFLIFAVLLLLTSNLVPLGFTYILVLYFVFTSAYSFLLKKIVLVDVISLGLLYTIRILAGHELFLIEYSSWLLTFSLFIFTSLGFLKRYSELHQKFDGLSQVEKLHGRGYHTSDIDIVKNIGIMLGMISILVFALYMESEQVKSLYRHTRLLWLLFPIFLYWISRIWLLGVRGKVHEDPVIFVAKDRTTYVILMCVLCIMYLAA